MLRFALAAVLALSTVTVHAQPVDDTKSMPDCPRCGMNREKFAHSRTAIEFEEGKPAGFCSIHCAAVELAVELDRTPTTIWVGDYGTKKLIEADKATWVIGGKKPGVMTTVPKWAFADKAAAEAFVKENGGKIVGFEEAMKAAYDDMYQDGKAIREKRKAMKSKSTQPAH